MCACKMNLHLLRWAFMCCCVAASALSHENLCLDGRLAPQFYLLGAQKSSTTSFTHDLGRSLDIVKPDIETCSSQLPPGWHDEKELQVFNNFVDDTNETALKEAWASCYPPCQREHRQVAWDCTPNYLIEPESPQMLARWYGSHMPSLYFMVILRQPLARMHSAFHHFKPCGLVSFHDYMTRVLMNSMPCDDPAKPFEDSLYAGQLARWFSIFDSKQFLIAPLKRVVAPGNLALQKVAKDLGIRLPNDLGNQLSEVHKRDHASVNDEMTPVLYERVNSLLAKKGGSARAVAKVLSGSRSHLFEYSGPKGSVVAVAAWLSRNW